MNNLDFWIELGATLLMAAAGYIITVGVFCL